MSIDLNAIRKRAESATETWKVGRGGFNTETNAEYIDTLLSTDIPALLAEVARLRADVAYAAAIVSGDARWDAVTERDALARKVERVRALTASMDRGVGYRVSGKPETWDAYHEGMSDFAGQVEDALDEEEAR